MEYWNSYLLFVVAIGPVSRILVALLHTLRSFLEIAAMLYVSDRQTQRAERMENRFSSVEHDIEDLRRSVEKAQAIFNERISLLETVHKDALTVPVTSPMNAIPPTENAEEGSDSQRAEHSKDEETPLAAPDTQRNTSGCLSR